MSRPSSLFKPTEPKPHEPGLPWSLAAAAKRLGVSEGLLRKAKKNGTLRTISFGRRVMVPDDELERVARCGLVAA